MRNPSQEHYSILKVSKDAGLDEIKKAYRKRAFELHPDLHPDNPNANKDFQLLNEAYVLLTTHAKGTNATRAKAYAGYAKQQKESTYYRQKKTDTTYKSSRSEEPKSESHRRTYSRAQSAYTHEGNKAQSRVHSDDPRQQANFEHHAKPSQEEVMQDILKDPFARRVYEDIYRTLHEESKDSYNQGPVTNEKKKKPFVDPEWFKEKVQVKVNTSYITKAKNWLKKQIDESLEYYLPIQSLYPMARIRLQIGQGISNESRMVEITLPHDFLIGKPVRLAGLGRKFGKWQGDLYIIFLPSSEE